MALIVLLLGLALVPATGVAFFAWWTALDAFVHFVRPNLNIIDKIIIACLPLAIGLSALLAGCWLDRFCHGRLSSRLFKLFGFILALAMCFHSGLVPNYLELMLAQTLPYTLDERIALLLGFSGSILITAATVALVPMSVQLSVELPAHWLLSRTRAGERNVIIEWAAWRSLLTLLVLGLMFNLMANFLGAELWPGSLLAK